MKTALLATVTFGTISSAVFLDIEPWTIELETPQPVDEGFPERLEDTFSLNCTFCHETIADEWSQTLHALAWEDPRYQASLLDQRRPESCHGCHIPEGLFVAAEEDGAFGRKPRPRTEETEPFRHGVSCKSCHLGPDGVIYGPTGIETDAHPTKQSEHFTEVGSNTLCASCHQTTVGPVIGVSRDFAAAGLDDIGMSCVACHMQPVERSMATDDDDLPTPERKGRSHLLQTPRDPRYLARAFALTVERDAGELVLVIANRTGHRVPALTERELRFEATVRADDGSETGRFEHVFTTRKALTIGAELRLKAPTQGQSLEIKGFHHPPGGEPVLFFDSVLSPEDSSHDENEDG